MRMRTGFAIGLCPIILYIPCYPLSHSGEMERFERIISYLLNSRNPKPKARHSRSLHTTSRRAAQRSAAQLLQTLPDSHIHIQAPAPHGMVRWPSVPRHAMQSGFHRHDHFFAFGRDGAMEQPAELLHLFYFFAVAVVTSEKKKTLFFLTYHQK